MSVDGVVVGVLAHSRSDRHTQDVLRSLSSSELALVDAMTAREVLFPPNRDIVGEGEVGLGLLLLAEGWAYRYRRVGGHCRQIIDFLLPGEIIGLQASLLGVLEHSVRSLTQVKLVSYDARLVSEAFEKSPPLALRFARHVSAEAARTDALTAAIGCCDAAERLAFLMLSLYRRQLRHGEVDPLDCPFPLRRQHLADALGLTGAHVNRTVNRLKQEGIASVSGRRLAIHDLERLAELAGVTL